MGHQLMEGGDEMNVSALFDDPYQSKEVGVNILYYADEEKRSQHRNTYPSRYDGINVGDLSPYLEGPGEY